MFSCKHRGLSSKILLALAVAPVVSNCLPARGEDVSPPVILQYFESSYTTIENRMPDVFAAGYGNIYTPPPGRADQGNFSVGYDQYDRFDLGYAGNPTLYGTESGLRATVAATHRAGMTYTIDMVWNHSGYSGTSADSRDAFIAAGGYPGMLITKSDDVDGDYHGAFQGGDYYTRVAGLIDIAQEKNYQYIRNPVVAGDSRNLPAGTTSFAGRLANVPTEANRKFYTDRDRAPVRYINDPATGEYNIPVYDFTSDTSTTGDPVTENALGYLMRNTQWLVQSVGIDNFRIDAAKNMPPWVLNYYDRAVFKASPRTLLDGSQQKVFGFSEVYTSDWGTLANYTRKGADTSDTVGGNRDVLDFPLFFAMRENLTNNGLTNDWNHIVGASFDLQDGYMNGSQGVHFVSSHDDTGAYLANVAYAYTLMLPGNAIVYSNPQEFGTNRTDFPKPGRSDALGGLYGEALTTLVDIRNRYGRGNYLPRLLEKENLAYEREKSALVLLSNRLDAGFDSRTIQTSFQPGQYLVELTGNAASSVTDPNNDIPEVVKVQPNGTVNVRFLRNVAPGTSHETDAGYLIYGLPTPAGSLTLSNVASTLGGWNMDVSGISTLTQSGRDQIAKLNATQRLADVKVIKTDSFDVTLRTGKVQFAVPEGGTYHDVDADGDNALIRLDEGLDLNGNGHVDYVDPNLTSYAFEDFSLKQPGFSSADNTGTYSQSINTTGLAEGYHYLTARAYRHRGDGGPAIFTDFKETIYIDRLKPISAVDSFNQYDPSDNRKRDLVIKSVDETANSVHVFLDLPANLTDSQVLAMVGGSNQAGQYDRDLFKYGYGTVSSGNHVATVVTYEITGNVNVQRLPGLSTQTTRGSGLGDLNYNNGYETGDVYGTSYGFEAVLYSQNAQFNPAADLNADGRVDDKDLWLLRPRYIAAGASQAVITEARNAELRRGNLNGDGATNSLDIDYLVDRLGTTSWSLDVAADDGKAGQGDVDAMVHNVFQTEYGDSNLDGKIDIVDLGALASHWQLSGAANWADADFNGDGNVNIVDLGLIASHWQFGVPGPLTAQEFSIQNAMMTLGFAESTGVPEPISVLPLSALAIACMTRRRQVRRVTRVHAIRMS